MKSFTFFKKSLFTFILLLCFYGVQTTVAQTKSKWKTKISFGGSTYSGNVNKFDMKTEGSASHADSSYEFAAFYRGIYSENKHVENNREISGGFSFDYRPENQVSPFGVISGYYNTYRNIDLRLTGLVGMKWKFFDNKKGTQLSISAAGLYENEEYTNTVYKVKDVTKFFTDSSGIDIPYDTKDTLKIYDKRERLRLSLRPRFKIKINDIAYLTHTTFYKFNVNNLNDYAFENKTTLSLKIAKKLTLDLAYEYIWESDESKAGSFVKNEDQMLIASFVLTF